jgi:hypothetical protein
MTRSIQTFPPGTTAGHFSGATLTLRDRSRR